MKVRFLKSAMQDMLDIKQYISKDNPAAANRLIRTFKEKINRLKQFPYSDRMILETLEPNLREPVISNYRIMYQVSNKYVNVFAVYESHRQPLLEDLQLKK